MWAKYVEGVVQNLQMTKSVLRTFLAFFFDNYLYIFHKTGVQKVILRCWTGLNFEWFKSYDTNEKPAKNPKIAKNTTYIYVLGF